MGIYSVHFSPTGGTRAVADILAAAFDAPVTDFELCRPEDELKPLELTADDLCIVAVPSFGGRVPGLCTRRLRTIAGHGATAVAVVVYGNRAYEDTLSELAATLRGAGFRVPAAIAAIAEHSVIRRFASGRPDRDDAEVLTGFARRIAELYEQGKLTGEVTVPGSIPADIRTDGPMAVMPDETCVRCGLCAAQCPAGAIDALSARTDAALCMGCMRCVKICPRAARHLDAEREAALDARLAPVCTEYRHNEFYLCPEA